METARGASGIGGRGVTLIELIVVLLIIGVLVVIGADYTGDFVKRYRLDTSAKDMMGRLRAAKMISITKNTGVSVSINTGSRSYVAFFDINKDGVLGAGDNYMNLDRGETSSLSVATRTVHSTVAIANAFFQNDSPTITFQPPSGLVTMQTSPTGATNGVVCFTATVDGKTEYRRIDVSPVVGKITLWKESLDKNPVCKDNANWDKAL